MNLPDSLLIRESFKGLGVFANRPIAANTLLFRIQGHPVNFDDTLRLGEKESYCLQIDSSEYLFLEPPFCFCNHSCDPNCGIKEELSVYTIRPIHIGEELTWDYSTSMLERHWTLKCYCRSPGCRHIVRDFDFLPKPVQRRYQTLGIVLPFIEKVLKTQLVKV
jgi:SET domain-containing protein